MGRRPPKAADHTEPGDSPQSPGSVLPARSSPLVARYAPGPFLDPQLVTPSPWKWRNTTVYVVRHSDGRDYRAVRVLSERREFVGYWAVELIPLSEIEGSDT